MTRRLLPALAALALAGLALAGCATGDVEESAPPAGDPAGQTMPEGSGDVEVDAAWLAGGSMIAVITYGSSTPGCQPTLDGSVLDDGVLVVSLVPAEESVCDGDLVPRGILVETPSGIDPADGLAVQVSVSDTFAEATLAPYAGGEAEDYAPSAGWAGDDRIAILTWGSSSCAPAVEKTTVVSPTEVAVTFATPRADQVCTMDMAPRVAVATVTGEVSRDATLSLGGITTGSPGDDAPGAAIPIG